MRVRKVDAAGDMVFGGDQSAFWRDAPDGVAQVVQSRLGLWERQWYLDLAEGTPYTTQILGKRTEALRDPAIQTRILQSPGVTEILSYDSVLDRATRTWTVAARIDTAYGRANATGPASSAADITTEVYEGR